ncbi:MAG: DUF1499 domain-containing protein [Roseibium sp.]|nr:DUF1499 domain-containing protein [Roseibium sp.]
MKTIAISAAVLLLIVAAAALFVRLAPVSTADVAPLQNLQGPGDYTLDGGHYAVRPLEAVDLAALETRILATVRTQPLSGSARDLPMVFVHRSAVWGFPDVTQVWVEEGNVHVYSHLVYGQSDLGVNRARMEDWFESPGSGD